MEKNNVLHTGEALVDDLNILKHDVTQIAVDAKHHAGAHVDATKKLLREKIQIAREAAAAQPLLILGAGFLVGFVFALRCRR